MKIYQKRKEAGLCVGCGKPMDNENGVYCTRCKGKRIARSRENRKYYKEHGICPTCGKNLLYGDEKRCLECRAYRANYYEKVEKHRTEEEKEKSRRKSAEAERKRKEQRKKNGICVKCGKRKADGGFVTCPVCREKARGRNAAKRQKCEQMTKEDYLEKRRSYLRNGKCWICGEPVFVPHKLCEKHYNIMYAVSQLPQVKEARKQMKNY